MENQFKRQAAIEKNIRDLNKADTNVAISGIIISQNENSLLLDDGTDQITAYFSEPIEAQGYVRVFGMLIKTGNGFELQGEFLQDLNKIDKTLHKKVKELLKP